MPCDCRALSGGPNSYATLLFCLLRRAYVRRGGAAALYAALHAAVIPENPKSSVVALIVPAEKPLRAWAAAAGRSPEESWLGRCGSPEATAAMLASVQAASKGVQAAADRDADRHRARGQPLDAGERLHHGGDEA
jgi:hypothetical protein